MYKILKDAAPDFHDLDNLGDPEKDVAISCSSRFVARLYDQKSFASSHQNINKLRVKLATGRDASLVRLPPSEAALRQHNAASFSILYTNFLPFPKKEDVVLHPERTCVPGRTLHVISEREEHSS
jgi:hypothetical protein